MSFKDTLNQRLLVMQDVLTTEQIIESRRYRNWELFDEMSDVEKMQCRISELEMFDYIISDISDDDYYEILKKYR